MHFLHLYFVATSATWDSGLLYRPSRLPPAAIKFGVPIRPRGAPPPPPSNPQRESVEPGGLSRVLFHGMASHLPPELIELIVDELRVSNPSIATIQSASLICSDFYIPCQQLLFSRFQLTLSDGLRPVERLRGLETSPRLASYIRDLRLSFPWSPSAASFDSRVNWVTTHGDLLNRVLGILSIDQIERFELRNWFDLCRRSKLDTKECRAVKDRLRATVERIIGGASLHTLSAKDMCISALRTCSPSLKHLVLEDAYPAENGEGELFHDVSVQAPKACLQSLKVYSTPVEPWDEARDKIIRLYQFLLHPNGPFDLGSLAHLSWMTPETFEGLEKIMAAAKGGLRSLELDLGFGSTNRYVWLLWMDWFCTELSSIRLRYIFDLETVCIKFKIPAGEDYRQPLAKYSWRSFGLEYLGLEDQRSFPALKEVDFIVSGKEEGRGPPEIALEVEREIYKTVPGLQSSGLLKVTMDFEGTDGVLNISN